MVFSIIVPVYNVEKYINRCVDSILNQNFSDFEIILVDDGSQDSCGIICDDYARMDRRVQVLHKKNGGLSDARNAGLKVARGDYISFVDGDDFIVPNYLDTLFHYLYKGYDLVNFCFFMVYPHSKPKQFIFKDAGREKIFISDYDKYCFMVNSFLRYSIGYEVWVRVYKRSIIEQNNIQFEDNQRIFSEDICFNLCYLSFVKKIITIQRPLYYYCRREDSIMGVAAKKCNLNRFNDLAKYVFDFYKICKHAYFCRHFSAIYYMIIHHELEAYFGKEVFGVTEYRLLNKEIIDKDFMKKMLKKLRRERRFLRGTFSSFHICEILNQIEYILSDNILRLKIRSKICLVLCKLGVLTK